MKDSFAKAAWHSGLTYLRYDVASELDMYTYKHLMIKSGKYCLIQTHTEEILYHKFPNSIAPRFKQCHPPTLPSKAPATVNILHIASPPLPISFKTAPVTAATAHSAQRPVPQASRSLQTRSPSCHLLQRLNCQITIPRILQSTTISATSVECMCSETVFMRLKERNTSSLL